ncbi:TetR/AcrR family transcriptional regulator [Phaeobacter porticola]|uniref:Transcriptional regulator, TetR family n=1 Tax=Phaeobacter porticola TaxID=1844006 RepID=A0A1L3IAH5_9RHOB|nr:TetR/AcrR family transcriptional regulator [Phaeobacter porticola]APG49137.1 transcriptional regulator, TetR family [Phaeobacter porticola]
MTVRFSKDDWLKAGLAQLANLGPDGVKLANLCKAQGRTTGAFYFHFRDHAAFISDLIAYWEKTCTDDVIAGSGAQAEQLNLLVVDLDHRIEVAMRQFGYQNRMVGAKLAAIDGKRIDFLTSLHAQSGALGAVSARDLAELEYAVFVGSQMIWQNDLPVQGKKLGAAFDSLLAAYLKRTRGE